MVDVVYFGKKKSRDGAILHGGDNTTGEGSGDDETISINLSKVDPKVDSIWPVVTIYTDNKSF